MTIITVKIGLSDEEVAALKLLKEKTQIRKDAAGTMAIQFQLLTEKGLASFSDGIYKVTYLALSANI